MIIRNNGDQVAKLIVEIKEDPTKLTTEQLIQILELMAKDVYNPFRL